MNPHLPHIAYRDGVGPASGVAQAGNYSLERQHLLPLRPNEQKALCFLG